MFFKLGKRMVKICKWVFTPKSRNPSAYIRLNQSEERRNKSCSFWGCCLKKRFWFNSGAESKKVPGLSTNYDHVSRKPVKAVPKGYLAVYVGQRDVRHRFLVPVMYCNHPLFVELLREAEEVYGHRQPGGITIPCRVSDFKIVRERIACEKRVKPARIG